MKKNKTQTRWCIVWVNEDTEQQGESRTGTFEGLDEAEFFLELLRNDNSNCRYDIVEVNKN